jgi:hypothetical protein
MVTVADASPESQQATPGRHAAPRSHLPVSVVAIIAATGVLLVAAAYTAGRFGHANSSWADRTYWLGQALIVVPVAVRLLSRRVLTSGQTVALVLIATVAEYLVVVCYSPAGFTYADELRHWRGVVNVLQTGKLSTVNYLLPISPHYPGLEELTAALVSITGLSVFTAGLIIAGIAHLLFVCVLYVLFREISGSYRIAGVAVLCYTGDSLFESFDSMFTYQTLALPFFGLILLAAWKLALRRPAGGRGSWLALAVLTIGAMVVTHHITSYMTVIMLCVITLAALISGNRRAAAWTALLAALAAGATACWLVFAAPQTWGYLQPFASGTLESIRASFSGHVSSPKSVGPEGNQLLASFTVLIVSGLLPVGWWQVWRRYRRQPWTVAMAIASVSWYGIVVLRLTAADGPELAGRAATFIYVPLAYIVALATGHLAGRAVRWQARPVAIAVLVVVLTLMFDGLINGWPPYWERLPGPYQVAGAERSVEPEVTDGATWSLAMLGPGNRFASDYGSYPVLGSYGDQNAIRNVAYLYTSPVYSLQIQILAQTQAIHYIWVDQRLSHSLPVSGQYFAVDPGAGKYKHPLSNADLDKFNTQGIKPGIDRIYDSGNIVIFELPGS